MNISEIRAIAKQWNLKTTNISKADLIRSIQAAEGNIPCFNTPARGWCREVDCLWMLDCEAKKSQ